MSDAARPRRNDPCPCGSGRKYKVCCGREEAKPRATTTPAPLAVDVGRTLLAARNAHRSGRLEEASRHYHRILEVQPGDEEALLGLARIHGAMNDYAGGIELAEQALGRSRRPAPIHRLLCSLHHLAGAPEASLAAAEAACRLEPKDPAAWTLVAACHERMNRIEPAAEAVARALRLRPDDPNALAMQVRLLRRDKRLDEAVAAAERVLATPAVADSTRAETAAERGFALEALGRHEEAWDAFVASNRIAAAEPLARRTDRTAWPRRIDFYRRGLTPAILRRFHGEDLGTEAAGPPCLLVGFSRSGTTMMEQILQAHPEIETSLEKPILMRLRGEIRRHYGGSENMPEMLAQMSVDDARRWRGRFWDLAEQLVGLPVRDRRFVHKQPLDTIELGMVATLFPEARIMVAIRDPRDVVLSCFQQHFEMNTANVHFLDLEDAAAFYAKVMDLWLFERDLLPVRFAEIRYEDAVDDLEREARRMCELFDVAFDPALLEFHRRASARFIATPSYSAVTEPVNRRAVGRWRRFASQLAPVLPTLERFVAAFGYAQAAAPADASSAAPAG